MQIGTEKIAYGTKDITFFLRQEDRKSLRITVTPELSVFVHAPIFFNKNIIFERIKKKAPWIMKQLDYFKSFHPIRSERIYKSGETHLYLGREYLLDVKIDAIFSESVKIKGKHIVVTTKDQSRVESLMNTWYAKNAKEKMGVYVSNIAERFKKYNVEHSELVLRRMKRRWGSCSNKGKITLNISLMQAPRGCIEYVIIHEFCHLIHFGHTKKFYDLQTKEMPNWKKWKEKLERMMA